MKRFSNAKVVLSLLGGVLAAAMLLAQAEPPLLPTGSTVPNWTVPPYRPASAEGGLQTMTDINYAGSFVPMVPCRVFDTRLANGPYGGPRLIANVTRNFDIDSGACGPIPAGVTAYSMNFGAILPDGLGFVTIWPAGAAQPTTSTINTVPGEVLANAAIVPAGSGGSISIFPNTGLHLYGDINGYFTLGLNPGIAFIQFGNVSGSGVGIFVNSANTNNSAGVTATVGPGFTDNVCCGPTALIGRGAFNGVAGVAQDRATVGVLVTAAGGPFAEGQLGKSGGASQAFGVNGFTHTSATAAGTAGVLGQALAAGPFNFGVKGTTVSVGFDAAGVKGVDGTGDPLGDTIDCGPCQESGVRGMHGLSSFGYGVLGISRNGAGVAGFAQNDTDATIAVSGYLGTDFGVDPGGGGSIWAVFGSGNIGATGTKFFVEPHPTDASKVIKYISLEGPEAGTYFRGKGRFQDGIAVIDVPEDFRMVTDPDGLSIQVTPIGDMATVAVQTIGLDRIVVKGSRNVEFFYTVNGVRSTFRDLQPITEGAEFRPSKPDSTMPTYLSEGQKRLLIRNGTYRPDGTVNMETAHRLGWDRAWDHERPTPQPDPSNP